MRVALSVDPLEPSLGGIGRYTLELVKGLARAPEVRQLRFFLGHDLVTDPLALLEPPSSPDVPIVRPPRRLSRWWRRRRHAASFRAMRSSLIHSTNFFLPDWADRGVATIHDLSVLRFPETHPKARLDDYALRFDRTLGRATRFITCTHAVGAELVSTLGVPADKISVVPNGVNLPVHPGTSRIREQLADIGLIPGQYSLCVSTIEPRKRIVELLDAYALLPDSERKRWPLVVVGKNGWLAEDTIARLERARSAGWAKWLGYASERLLDALYFGAHLSVYPSRYEGFGLPPIEAMAHGVPTLISDDPSLVEVSGAAAMVVDADDAQAFSQSLLRGLQDDPWRSEAIRRGRILTQSLGWDRSVAGTVQAYRLALDEQEL